MEDNKDSAVYYRIPLQEAVGYCPVCFNRLNDFQEIDCSLHSATEGHPVKSLNLPVCEHCLIPSGSGSEMSNLPKDSFLEYFRVETTETVDEVKAKMIIPHRKNYAGSDYDLSVRKNKKLENIPVVGTTAILEQGKNTCPKCNRVLTDKGAIVLPLNDRYNIVLTGRTCTYCNTVYASETKLLTTMLYNREKVVIGFKYNGKQRYFFIKRDRIKQFKYASRYLYRYYSTYDSSADTLATIMSESAYLNYRQDFEQIFDCIKNEADRVRERRWSGEFSGGIDSTYLIRIYTDENGKKLEYTVIDQESDSDDKKNILFYGNAFARELLTAALRPEREGKAKFAGKEYNVDHYVIGNSLKYGDLVVEDLGIKRDGGYRSSYLHDTTKEGVVILLYSPVYDIYETLNATYDTENYDIYVDFYLIREFIKRYGNPGVRFYPVSGSKRGKGRNFKDLNDESALRALGYTVNYQDGLTTKERQDILVGAIELGILTVSKIITLLDFFITTHNADKYEEAREKWAMDKIFIQNQNFEAARVMIAR